MLLKIILSMVFVLGMLFFIGGCVEEKGGDCVVDDDCVKMQITCCPCSMSGKEVCVPVSNASAYIPKNCPLPGELMCGALYSCKVKNCVCIEGGCEAVLL